MKTCPKCKSTYDDETLNFCLEDGEWLNDPGTDGEATRSIPAQRDPSEAPTKQKLVETDETAILPTGAVRESPDPRRKGAHWKFTVPAVIVLFALIAGAYLLYRQILIWELVTREPDIEVERLTGDGKVREAAISPDGKLLAFLEVKNDTSALLVKQIETNSTVEILKENVFANINNVVFSPDGNFVYFSAVDSEKRTAIHKVPSLGGTPVMVPIAAMSFSLSPDGKRIAYYGDDAETTETLISVAGADGADPRKIVSKSGNTWVEPGIAWSPDGDKLIFVEGHDDRLPNPELSLSVYSFDDESIKPLGSSLWRRIDDDGIVWDPSGSFLYVTGEQAGSEATQVWRVSYPAGESVRLTRNRQGYRGLSITSDGSRLVTIEETLRTGVWVSPDLDPMRAIEVLPGTGDTWGISWTPEGKIVYVSDRSGAPEVWMMNADGSDQRQLTNDRLPKLEPVVSPDGKAVVYFSPVEGFQLYRVPITGGNPSRIATGQIGPESPDFSKDGKYIVFSAWTGGKQSLYRIPAAGGKSERLTDYPSNEPNYSPDGSMIACFYLPGDAQFPSIGIIPAEGGSPVKTFDVPTTTTTSRGLVWTPDGKQVTYIVINGEKSDLWSQPVAGGDPVRLTDFGRPWIARRQFSWDGSRVAVTRGEGFRDALILKVVK